ncbi:MAG: tetratricopeptide repeat protein [Crocinitomicaceae bacterium]|nr:tetratricopeptide repeat protein [Crocinitomicaceae bacterium]MDG1776963.1 tetratricopeptide repeat protein [Crocinitomicaceae bacterium]
MFANKTHKQADEALKNGKIEKSIELYSRALEESPNECNILSDRGVAYLHANQKENSLTDFNRAVELQPDYGYRYASRAFARNNFGDIDGAIRDYEKAVELDPDDPVGYNNLGLLLEQKGYQKEADERFKRADTLSEMEDKLLNVIDKLEEKPSTPLEPNENTHEISEGNDSAVSEFKKLFTSKTQLKAFFAFLKNGFKIK